MRKTVHPLLPDSRPSSPRTPARASGASSSPRRPTTSGRSHTTTRRATAGRTCATTVNHRMFLADFFPLSWEIELLKKGCVRKLAVKWDPFYELIAGGPTRSPYHRHYSCINAASLESSYGCCHGDQMMNMCICAFSHELVLNSAQLFSFLSQQVAALSRTRCATPTPTARTSPTCATGDSAGRILTCASKCERNKNRLSSTTCEELQKIFKDWQS